VPSRLPLPPLTAAVPLLRLWQTHFACMSLRTSFYYHLPLLFTDGMTTTPAAAGCTARGGGVFWREDCRALRLRSSPTVNVTRRERAPSCRWAALGGGGKNTTGRAAHS